MAFWTVLAVALAVTVGWLQGLPAVTVTPPSTSPTASPTPSPSGTTSTEPPASADEPELTHSRLYDLSVSGSCPVVDTPRSRSAYERQVRELLGCLETMFRPVIEAAGGDFSAVEHQFFDRRVQSSCGSQSDAYAFYCEADETIYFSDRVYGNADYSRLAVADTVIHEYSHHVQAMMGILEAADERDEGRAVKVRRIELQVFCMTYYVFAAVPSFELTDADRSFFLEIWGNTDDPEGHGSVKAQQYWGPRGLEATDFGACNTWSVSRETVR